MSVIALPRLLTIAETADALGLQPSTLNTWRSTKRYDLPWIRSGRLIRYKEDDIARFIESRRQSPTRP